MFDIVDKETFLCLDCPKARKHTSVDGYAEILCKAYLPAGQQRWNRLGHCPCANRWHEDHPDKPKPIVVRKRVGQQKQRKE